MRDLTIELQFQLFPPHVHRGHHVLILLRDARGNFILGCKQIYPEGICRLLGGGVETGEQPDPAAVRELEEETGLKVAAADLTKLGSVQANLTDQNQKKVTFTSHVYFHDCGEKEPQAADDVDELCFLSRNEVIRLIERYTFLSTEIDPKVKFAWSDYGQLYSFIHQFAVDEVAKLGL